MIQAFLFPKCNFYQIIRKNNAFVSQLCYNTNGVKDNMKSEVVHARVDFDVKKNSEKILGLIGITISQAVDLFLRQVVLKKGLPFKLDSEENETTDIEKLAYLINSTDGVDPSPETKKIIHLYAKGDIDYEVAKYALLRSYKQ